MVEIATDFMMAKTAYDKFVKESKGFFGFGLNKKEELVSFSQVQKLNEAYTSTSIGLKNVPLDNIIGSVQKYMDFDIDFVPRNKVIESRWCKIYMAFMDDIALPPVQLYKIKDDYFVYDGNHRISVAKHLKFPTIEAEVLEFIPSTGTKENYIYREKFLFSKETGIDDLEFSELGQFQRIKKEILDYKKFLLEKKGKETNLIDCAEMWYKNLYRPIIQIMNENNIESFSEDRTRDDFFIYFLDHKYFVSEKKNKDVGFSYSLVDFLNMLIVFKVGSDNNTLAIEESNIVINSVVIENLKKLQRFDKRRHMDFEQIKKYDELIRLSGMDFEHIFRILFEIDRYMAEKNIEDDIEGVNRWYEDIFQGAMNNFDKRVRMLPKRYSKPLEIITEKKERLFYSFRNYLGYYNKKVSCREFCPEKISSYILEIYLPIVEIILKKGLETKEKIIESYYGIQGRYYYIIDSKEKDVSMSDAADLYFNTEGEKYQSVQVKMLKFSGIYKRQAIADEKLKKLSKKIDNKELFEEILEKYGSPRKFSTIEMLKKSREYFNKNSAGEDWVKDKLYVDIRKLVTKKEILIHFKTKSVLQNLKEDEVGLTLLDYYADILAYGNYLGMDVSFVDMIDLALEYKYK